MRIVLSRKGFDAAAGGSPAPSSRRLRTACRGQEFVLDATCYPEVWGWLDGVFAAATA